MSQKEAIKLWKSGAKRNLKIASDMMKPKEKSWPTLRNIIFKPDTTILNTNFIRFPPKNIQPNGLLKLRSITNG